MKQAAELEDVSGSQHAQHVIQAHLHLVHVEVLQGRGEGWGGSIRGQPSAWGLCSPVSPTSRRPPPPFTTSVLELSRAGDGQDEAGKMHPR